MPSLLDRFTHILDGLRRAVGNQWRAMKPPVLLPSRISHFVAWTLHRLPRALEQARAGEPPAKPRVRPDQPRPKAPPQSPRAIATQAFPFPRRESWLIPLIPVPHHVAVYQSLIGHLLTDPELAPLLPHPKLNRLLRPLCRMLGLSAQLPPPAAPGGYVPPPPFQPPPPPPPAPPRDPWADCALPTTPFLRAWPPTRILPTG